MRVQRKHIVTTVVVIMALFAVVGYEAANAEEDTSPPELVEFDFSPKR